MKEEYGFLEKYWVICIAVVIVCINIVCRIKDGIANREYEISEGKVVSITSETATLEQGGYYAGRYHVHKNGKVYYAEIEYRPRDSYWDKHFRVKCELRHFDMGDPVTVMYDPDNIYDESYLAKKDWITGAWLVAEKDYNTPLMIAAVIVAAGIAYLYLIGVKKLRFKNSWMVISSAVLVSGAVLMVWCFMKLTEGGEMADEAFTGLIIGIALVLLSSVFVAKIPGKLRKKTES